MGYKSTLFVYSLWFFSVFYFCFVSAVQIKASELEDKDYKNDPDFNHFQPKKGGIFFAGPCQKSCAYVRNKARYAIRTRDVGIAAQAYINANKGLFASIPPSWCNFCSGVALGTLTCIQPSFMYASISAIALYQATLVQGQNAYHYWIVMNALEDFIVDSVGEEAFMKLKKIKSYRDDGGKRKLREWLDEQRIRITSPISDEETECLVFLPLNENNV